MKKTSFVLGPMMTSLDFPLFIKSGCIIMRESDLLVRKKNFRKLCSRIFLNRLFLLIFCPIHLNMNPNMDSFLLPSWYTFAKTPKNIHSTQQKNKFIFLPTFSKSTIIGWVDFGTNSESGTPVLSETYAMAVPAFPPEEPTRRLAPSRMAVWQVRPMPRILKEPVGWRFSNLSITGKKRVGKNFDEENIRKKIQQQKHKNIS